MLLRVIGCWSPYPRPGEACSGYLLSSTRTRVLLDCGHSVCSQLGRFLAPEELDAAVITHFHPDHYVDLYALRHAIKAALMRGVRQTPLPVYVPQEPVDLYRSWADMKELHLIPFNDETVAVGDLFFQAFPVYHSLPAYGVKVEHDGRSMVYSADTRWDPRLVKAVQGIDLLLCETSFLQGTEDYAEQLGHMTTRQAGRLAQQGEVDRLVATHFWPEFDLREMQAQIEQAYQGTVIMARSDLSIQI